MKLRRVLSCLMALLLVCSLPVSVLADTWYLEDGSITVSATESGQTVSQGSTSKDDDAPVITQRDSETATTNTVTIKAAEDATANVTIQDVNIVISDEGAPKDHSGEAAVTIDVAENAEANVTLDGVNIDVGGTGGEIPGGEKTGEAAVQITGNGDVTIELDGENSVQSGYRRAGVEKNTTAATETEPANGTGELTITDETGTTGSLEATGGYAGSGIGGGRNSSASNITITGSAEVIATGGDTGAGIGGGSEGSGRNITIQGSAEVTAQGGDYGAGIGGGMLGSGTNITIQGSAEVTAKGSDSGAGIGGGILESGSDITISGDAQVKAQGGSVSRLLGAGSSIGSGGARGQDGQEVTPNTKDLNEGWIATYAPGTTNLDTTPDSLTYKGASNVTGAQPIVKLEPTCTEAGHEAGFSVDGAVVAVTIPATDHNVPGGYTPLNNATCTTLGTMAGYCTNCKTTVTIPDPNSKLKDHTFTTYVPDPNNLATCTEAGTKTAVCDVCHKVTNTVIDPAKDHSMGTPYTTKEPTCQEEGVERSDCENCDYYETSPLKKDDHSYGEFSSDNNATCTADGTKTRNCIWCGLPDTVPDPGTMLRHQFTNYVSDGNATCIEDGTKTAKCDHEGCGETDTVTDEGSRLPFYLVKDEGGRRIPCQEQKQDGVLTITVDADFAILTGTLGGMRALKGQGVDTIVFVTSGATSTFAIEDLLAQGSAASTYMLTHDGETVPFTLGADTDISKILK